MFVVMFVPVVFSVSDGANIFSVIGEVGKVFLIAISLNRFFNNVFNVGAFFNLVAILATIIIVIRRPIACIRGRCIGRDPRGVCRGKCRGGYNPPVGDNFVSQPRICAPIETQAQHRKQKQFMIWPQAVA